VFPLFKKDPSAKLQKEYQTVLEQAMQAQRKGDIRLYSKLSDKAEAIANTLDQLNKDQ
jgi:hypothetical protein